MNIYFLDFNHKSNKLNTFLKTIKFAELGFKYDSIKLINCFNQKGIHNGNPYITLGFNLNNDKSLGLSTIFFDFEKQTYRIISTEILNSGKGFVEDFNDFKIKRTSSENEISFYLQLKRAQFGRNGKMNTPLGPEYSDDLIMISLNTLENKYSNPQVIAKANTNLEYIFKEDNVILFVYEGNTLIEKFDNVVSNSAEGSKTFDIVKMQDGINTCYRNTLDEDNDKKANETEENMILISYENQKLSTGINLYFLNGIEMYSQDLNYTICKLNIFLD